MAPTMIFSLIFVLILLLLITGKYHRSVAAMLGALLVIGFGVRYGLFGMNDIMGFVDVETVILIIGLMILCEALGRSGFFQFLGLSLANAIGGDERKLTIALVFLGIVQRLSGKYNFNDYHWVFDHFSVEKTQEGPEKSDSL